MSHQSSPQGFLGSPTPQPGQHTNSTTTQPVQHTNYTAPQPGQNTNPTATQPGQHTYSTATQPGQHTNSTATQPGKPTSFAPQQASGTNINQQNVNYYNYATQSNYQPQPGHQAFHNYPPGHYQHIGPGPPSQPGPPAAGYNTQPPGPGTNPLPGGYSSPTAAGYSTEPPGPGNNPPPGGYSSPTAAGYSTQSPGPGNNPPPGGYPSPHQGPGYNPYPGGHFNCQQGSWHNPPPGGHFSTPHAGQVYQVPAQNIHAQMMMNNVYNTGCTVNNVGSIGKQTTYNIIGSNVGHVGPKITKNISIENLSIGMGVKKEEIDTFTNFLGDDKNNDDYLETFTTLMHEHNFKLPSVSTMTRSTCLIQHLGPHGGKWHGTGFLSTLPDFEGAALLSAGHNFADEGNLLKDFESFHLLFNNELGLNASSLKSVEKNAVIDFNLTTFMSKFPYTTLVLTYGGKQLIQHGTQPPTEKPHKNTNLDYFALILHGHDARLKINQMNLDFVEAAPMKELEKSGEPVFIFGYPGMKFCVCCKKASDCSCGRPRGICVCRKNCNCGPSTPPCSCYPARSPCQHKSCSCQHSLRFSYALSKSEKLKDKEHMKYELDTLGGMSGAVITGTGYKVKGIHILGRSERGNYNKAQTLIAVMKDMQKLNILKNEVAEKCKGPLDHQDIPSTDHSKKEEECKVQ